MVGLVKLNGKTQNLSYRRRSIGIQEAATSKPEEIISSAVLKNHIFSDVF